jgi:integrase
MPKQMPNRKRLTDLAVARMGPGPITWDTLLPCFGIRPGARTKTWIVNIKGRKRKVGMFPEMSAAEVRVRARAMLEGVAPASDKLSFADLATQFLEHARTRKGRPWRDNTKRQYRRNLTRYAKPLHQREVGEIARRDVAALLRAIATESGATTAKLVRAMLRRLFEYGIEVGAIELNPAAHTPSYEVSPRSRVLSDIEIAAIWEACTIDGHDFAMIVRLLLWTGCRRSEAGGMRWSEFSGGSWLVPPERTKNHRLLELPLPRQAAAAISRWPRIVGRDLLFGRSSPNGFGNWDSAKRSLDARLGFARPWLLHDLRRTVESRLAELGVSKDLRGRLLNHGMDPISAAYDHHHYTAEKRQTLQLWADQLEEIVASAGPTVIKLRRT